jgi:hypothetical protein
MECDKKKKKCPCYDGILVEMYKNCSKNKGGMGMLTDK